jgi:hypothetical protein
MKGQKREWHPRIAHRSAKTRRSPVHFASANRKDHRRLHERKFGPALVICKARIVLSRASATGIYHGLAAGRFLETVMAILF